MFNNVLQVDQPEMKKRKVEFNLMPSTHTIKGHSHNKHKHKQNHKHKHEHDKHKHGKSHNGLPPTKHKAMSHDSKTTNQVEDSSSRDHVIAGASMKTVADMVVKYLTPHYKEGKFASKVSYR